MKLQVEADQHARRRREQRATAHAAAAFFLAFGVDLDAIRAAAPLQRRRYVVRLERLIERERLRGSRRHWSYDLNRHIALKQALDRIGAPTR